MFNVSKIKIEITTKQDTPKNINNPVLSYIQNKEKQGNRLLVQVYYDDIEIGKGIILDFYKQFENIEDFGEPHTRIISFDYHGKKIYKNTCFGDMIYKIKNFKNPPIDKVEKEKYIQEISAIFMTYLKSLESKVDDLKLTYIPSSAEIPNDIAKNLSKVSKKEILNIVDKNRDEIVDSKSITTFEESMAHADKKYIFDDVKIKQNEKVQYLIIDDVCGNGSSIVTILKKLYDTTKMLNYFLIVVKDVKR